MADGGISDRGGRRSNSLFMKSPERRLPATEKKAGTTVTSPAGKAGDFHSDIKELMKNKQQSDSTLP
jgi:hypothetical protein